MAKKERLVQKALVVETYGRNHVLRLEDGSLVEGVAKSKRGDYACNDVVEVERQNERQAMIVGLAPRRSLFYRQDENRTKIFAANIDRIYFVVAPVPRPNDVLLTRCQLAANFERVDFRLVVNKSDLPGTPELDEIVALQRSLGVEVVFLSALEDPDFSPLELGGKVSIFIGQSGVGKSTITNALLGEERQRTGEVSEALLSGKHTTTHTRLFDLPDGGRIIDSPGLQVFGLNHVPEDSLIDLFPDLAKFKGNCRFHNCTHRMEPGCAIKEAASKDPMLARRLEAYVRILEELMARPKW